MKLREWYALRGPKFVFQRGSRLLERYGLSSGKAMRRIERCLETLAQYGCAPTLPTPAVIVQRYPRFIRRLQDAGAEIAVHGYQHVDLNAYPLKEAVEQLEKAARTFDRLGIGVHGFRCPYVGCRAKLLDALPPGLFRYSSNETICWDLPHCDQAMHRGIFYNTLDKFYHAKTASDTVCVPWNRSNLVEIPACVPDDLQLRDGLQLSAAGITQAWKHILHQTHQRGELFTLLFHTEMAALYEVPFVEILGEAKRLQPSVWFARLRDIADWWREKSNFKIEIIPITTGLNLHFTYTPRATILVRGLDNIGSVPIWDEGYHRLKSNVLEISTNPRPLVGLAASASERMVTFLHEQGYILDTGETASSCGTYLDKDTLSKLTNDRELVNYIETSPAPLVRFWRWPDGNIRNRKIS